MRETIMKILLFGFDGLRPDCVNEELMPRLHRFLQDNVTCTNSRAVFPTETYVNHPSIFTGFLPESHGLVANAYFDPAVSRKEFFLGSYVDRIEEAEQQTGGKLLQVPSLTETLVQKGLTYLSISSNSPGSTRLMAHKAASIGGINISVNGINYAYPEEMRSRYTSSSIYGENIEIPDIKGMEKMNEIVHDLFQKSGMPDVSIIWYGEPDHTFHAFGLGSEQADRALRAADACFGEMLDAYWKEDVQVIVLSDHGHITVEKHFDLTRALEDRGFVHSENLENPDADFTLLWGYSGNIYVHKPNQLVPIVRALQEMPETGMLFTRNLDGIQGIVEGTFSARLVGGEYSRAGDIRFVLRSFNSDFKGYPGTCICAAPIAIGCGIHGGLHEAEVHTVLGFGGSKFRKHAAVDSVTGVIDVTPTIYHILGIQPSVKPQGEAIAEALNDEMETAEKNDEFFFSAGYGSYLQTVKIIRKNGIPYLLDGERVK